MFDKLLTLFTGEAAPDVYRPDNLQLAVAALLVEAATTDNDFDADERRAIRHVLANRFNLTPAETDTLLEAAINASAGSVQLFGFTRGLAKRLDENERIRIIEMLWEVAYADGRLTAEEDSLIRRVAGLIYVSDRDRGAARRRALARKGVAE
jgi:uncharacterized tellurite resistance protein B-like protein